ncbi:hypothetical protein J3E69DRAFT_328268 [Trichoderma sp. SZMC 28015]
MNEVMSLRRGSALRGAKLFSLFFCFFACVTATRGVIVMTSYETEMATLRMHKCVFARFLVKYEVPLDTILIKQRAELRKEK